MQKHFRTALLLIFAAAGSIAGWAQATSQIQGTIQDATGAAVPGAEIKATQTGTGAVRTTTSGADGGYVLTNLPIGPYRIEVSKQGFSQFVQTGVVLQVSASPTIDVAMKVGQVTEQVQVEANAALVETQSTGIGAVIENQRILELPLNGRQATDLIQLAGAAVPSGTSSSRSMQGGQAISVAGGQTFGVAYFLDGGIHNNPFDNLNLPLPFPDALQEFKVETGTLTAQNGMHSAAAVSAVTKSGTNDFHGDLFEFFRNGDMNARNFFAARRDTLKRNQFGGVIGGPVIKNKLFAFGGYQGTITRSDPADVLRFIPTQAMINGDFSACKAITTKFPYVGGKLPANLISPVAQAIDKQIGQFATDPCGAVRTGAVAQLSEKQIVGRMDYQMSDKQTLFGRYLATTFVQSTPFNVVPDILNTFQGGRNNLAQSFTLGDTYLLSSTVVNSLRAAVNRTAIHRTNGEIPSAPNLGINTFSYLPKYFQLTMGGNGFQIGGGTENDAIFRTTTYQLSDDLNWVKGAHQIAFGGTLSQWRSAGYANVRSAGQFNIDGSYTGSALSDFVAGILSGNNAYIQSAPNTLQAREFYAGFYAQDTWKLSKRLTLNYGVRYEPWFPQQLTNGAIYNFDLARFSAGTKSTVYKNAPAGFLFPGDKGFAGQSGMNKKLGQFAPRLGLAFDPFGDGKTSIRASFGRAYDYVNGQFYINTANAPPWGSEIRINGLAGNGSAFVPGVNFTPLSNPFAGSGQSNIFPVTFDANAAFSLNGPFIALPPDLKTTVVNSWNFSVQRQVGRDWLFAASYIGTETEHLWLTTALNPITTTGCTSLPASATGCLGRRRLTLTGNPDAKFLGFVDQFGDGGTQSYNGLLLSAQKRLSQHFSTNVNWAWSHCIGDNSQAGGTPNVGNTIEDQNNRRGDRGNCLSDRRHIVNFTLVAQSPKFSGTWARRVGSNWSGSFIYRAASGAPLTVVTNTDRQVSGITGPGGIGQRVNYIGGSPYGDGSVGNWLNPAAFALPGFGTIGNVGAYNLLAPKFFQLDLSIVRRFALTERFKFEIRAEAFNLTNSRRPGNANAPGAAGQALSGVQTNRSVSNFGQVFQALDPRILQLAMKFTF